MSAYDDFVERIVSHSGIPTSKVGRDLERELRAHLEDAVEDARSQGFDEAGIPQSVYDRFGDPDEIARDLPLRIGSNGERSPLRIPWCGWASLC